MAKPTEQQARLIQELLNQAYSLLQGGDAEGVALSCEAILEIAPKHFEALNLLGGTYIQSGRHTDACAILKRALAVNPRSAQTHTNYGTALAATGAQQQAIEHHRKAVLLQPDSPYAHYNLANALRNIGKADEAIQHYRRTLALKPDNPEALNNLSLALGSKAEFPEAASLCQRLISLGSHEPNLYGRLQHLNAQHCNWHTDAGFLEHIEHGEVLATPFSILPMASTARQQLHCAMTHARAQYPSAPRPAWSTKQHDRIRIGYFSGAFFHHATSTLMVEMLEKHDRSRFEVFAFAFGFNRRDAMRERIINAVEHFSEVSEFDDNAITQLARKHEIDIAVDLLGYTADCRAGLFAQHCAPIQVNYLGYPGTMGADFIDYIIGDPTVTPQGSEGDFSEKIVRLPHCYQPNDTRRAIAGTSPRREEMGLPPEAFVFCCFNNNFKITPDVFDIWMRLLGAVEYSVLWLFEDNPYAMANLRTEAAQRGIAGGRIVFAKRVPPAEHLARQRCADLFLDTFYYNAHTTASDALWVGLPVLTRIGTTFASRVAASLLRAAGLPELVTESSAQYEDLALELARNPERLAALRARLAQTRESCPLFDSTRYTRNLEKAYALMWQRFTEGLSPGHMDVPDENP